MKYLSFLLLIFAISCNADDCRVEKKFDPVSHHFLACKMTSVTPSYVASIEESAIQITEGECDLFCLDFSLIPIPHEDHFHTEVIERSFVNTLLAQRERHEIQLPPEVFLQEVLRLLIGYTASGDADDVDLEMDEIVTRSLQSQVPQRMPNQILVSDQYRKITVDDLTEEDRHLANGKKCSICRESIFEQINHDHDVIRLNCGNPLGCDFCKECIEEQYHFDTRCPNCKREISRS